MNRDLIKGHRKAVKDRLKQQWFGVLDEYEHKDEDGAFNEWETYFQRKTSIQNKMWAAMRRRENQFPVYPGKKRWNN